MADDSADRAVVHRVVCVRVEERRLQNACRKHDLVHVGVVIRIHRGRCHAPVSPVDRFADLLHVPVSFEFLSANRIQDEWAAVDLQ